jgi:protein-disulfide isomerase
MGPGPLWRQAGCRPEAMQCPADTVRADIYLGIMRPVSLLIALLLACMITSAGAFSTGKTAGVSNAPIVIEVFSDFQCSHCKSLHEGALRSLMKDYVASGKVYLIHRDFPLPGNIFAPEAAAYACAAERISKYDKVADVLFASQASWSASGKVDEAACSVLTPAEAKKVRSLAKDPGVAAEIERDSQLARKMAIRQTPTLIITHRLRQYPLAGSVSYDLLRRFLDELLAK